MDEKAKQAAEKILSGQFDIDDVIIWVHWKYHCNAGELHEKITFWLVDQHLDLLSQLMKKEQLLMAASHTVDRYRVLFGPLPMTEKVVGLSDGSNKRD